MADREPQIVTMSRQGILVATAMGVGMLTLSYVIGVQVGKRGLTHSRPKASSIDDELKEFAEPLDVQINMFKTIEGGAKKAESRPSAAAQAPKPPAAADSGGQPVSPPPGPAKPPAPTDRYTAQVGAFRDRDAARRAADRLKSQGMLARVVSADGMHKVQLDWSLARADLDARLPRLRSLGYEPSAVRVQ
jgi:cell division protein FtsN